MFIEIPPDILSSVASNSDRMPKLYYHPLFVARKFFWFRLRCIYNYIENSLVDRHCCLDFGCGSGVFLPSLSTLFDSVSGIDIELVEAPAIVKHYALKNVRLIHADIYTTVLDEKFDVIIAADVLEHFNELDTPIMQIKRWLKDDGLLITSLPTENIFTRLTRIIGRYTKPKDHYYSAEQIETKLYSRGFCKIKTERLISIFPLYVVSSWQKQSENNESSCSIDFAYKEL